jgi:translation elongation factor EF-G
VKAARAGPHARYFVLDAEVPLATLLGYADWLDELAEGSADLSMWLARCDPVVDDGPEAA